MFGNNKCVMVEVYSGKVYGFLKFRKYLTFCVKEVWYNCNPHSSAHLFIIEISSHTIQNGSSPKKCFFNVAAL